MPLATLVSEPHARVKVYRHPNPPEGIPESVIYVDRVARLVVRGGDDPEADPFVQFYARWFPMKPVPGVKGRKGAWQTQQLWDHHDSPVHGHDDIVKLYTDWVVKEYEEGRMGKGDYH